MKRVIASVLIALLLCMAFAGGTAWAASPMITVSEAEGRAGDEVKLSVEISGNPGIIAMQLQIAYDTRVLELKKAIAKDYAGVSFGPTDSESFSLIWEDVLHPNTTKNGVMAELTFQIKANAPAGDSTVRVSYDPENVFDESYDNVTFHTQNGSVTVLGQSGEGAAGASGASGVDFTEPSEDKSSNTTGTTDASSSSDTNDPQDASPMPFSDVAVGAYYYNAVLWAVGSGITQGSSAMTFSPSGVCDRAQMVTFLWRAAGSPEPNAVTDPFSDVPVNAYYYKAVLWAAEKGITQGTGQGRFSPNARVTRDQSVTFLYRAVGQKVEGNNPFVDISKELFCYDAVLWALQRGITTGTSASTFSPSADCLRGQIVTMLYRHYAQ